MSCRKCVDSCQCVFTGATGVTVTGTGSAADPYVATVDTCAILDGYPEQERPMTSTDWIFGQDSTGTCVKVRTGDSVHVQSVGFNASTGLLTITETDGTPYSATLVPDLPDSVVTTDGNGTGVVHSGVSDHDVDITLLGTQAPATNLLNTDSSGGLNIECSDVAGCGPFITVADTTSINQTLTGAVPGVLSAVVIPGPGIVVDGTGVRVNTLPWAYPCANTLGVAISCDASGNLRGAPEHTSIRFTRPGAALNGIGNVPAGTASQSTGLTVSANIVNPSTCRSMVGMVGFDSANIIEYLASGVSTLTPINGGGVSSPSGGQSIKYAGSGTTMPVGLSINDEVVIAAGAAHVLSITTTVGGPNDVAVNHLGTTASISGFASTV